MKRRGTSTRQASATTTPVPDHTRPATGPCGKGPPQDPLPPQPGDHSGQSPSVAGVRERRQQLRVVSCQEASSCGPGGELHSPTLAEDIAPKAKAGSR
jgi:hypothetical protein